MFNYGGRCQNGAIVEIFIVSIGEIEVPRGPAFATKFGEVGGVCMDSENHVVGMVADAGVGVRCHVIEELVACFRYSVGAFGLPGRDRTESSE